MKYSESAQFSASNAPSQETGGQSRTGPFLAHGNGSHVRLTCLLMSFLLLGNLFSADSLRGMDDLRLQDDRCAPPPKIQNHPCQNGNCKRDRKLRRGSRGRKILRTYALVPQAPGAKALAAKDGNAGLLKTATPCEKITDLSVMKIHNYGNKPMCTENGNQEPPHDTCGYHGRENPLLKWQQNDEPRNPLLEWQQMRNPSNPPSNSKCASSLTTWTTFLYPRGIEPCPL